MPGVESAEPSGCRRALGDAHGRSAAPNALRRAPGPSEAPDLQPLAAPVLSPHSLPAHKRQRPDRSRGVSIGRTEPKLHALPSCSRSHTYQAHHHERACPRLGDDSEGRGIRALDGSPADERGEYELVRDSELGREGSCPCRAVGCGSREHKPDAGAAAGRVLESERRARERALLARGGDQGAFSEGPGKMKSMESAPRAGLASKVSRVWAGKPAPPVVAGGLLTERIGLRPAESRE